MKEVFLDSVLMFGPEGRGGSFRVGGGGEGGHFGDGSEGGCDWLGYVIEGGVFLGFWERFCWGLGLWWLGGRAFGWTKFGLKFFPLYVEFG